MPKKTLQSAVYFGIIPMRLQNQPPSLETRIIYTRRRTRLLRVFFMRSAHAPQKRLARPSMVACSGKGFALCCFPCMTVFQPVTRYRQAWKLQAVTSNQFLHGVTQMYQFIFALMRTPTDCLKVRILADNEHQARSRFDCGDSLLFVGRINLHRQNTHEINRTFATKGGVYA